MSAQYQHTCIRKSLHEPAMGINRDTLVFVRAGPLVRIGTLHGTVDDIPRNDSALAAGGDKDAEVVRRMSWRRYQAYLRAKTVSRPRITEIH